MPVTSDKSLRWRHGAVDNLKAGEQQEPIKELLLKVNFAAALARFDSVCCTPAYCAEPLQSKMHPVNFCIVDYQPLEVADDINFTHQWIFGLDCRCWFCYYWRLILGLGGYHGCFFKGPML